MSKRKKIILGIDPGTQITGYGLINVVNNEMELLSLGIIHLKKYNNHIDRIRSLYERTQMLIKEYKPDSMAIEAPFYGKNIQSTLKLGRAQGAVMIAAIKYNINIYEYLPKKVKMSITGNGNASKYQVSEMLKTLFKLEKTPKYFDATDGLAVAVCHYFQNDSKNKRVNKNNWKSFLKDNPDRIL